MSADFIEKEFPQHCGDSIKILKKGEKQGYWECEFIKYPYKICAQKSNILRGTVINPRIEEEEFIKKEWPQNCGDTLKILSKEYKNNRCYWKCEFINSKDIILGTKSEIKKGTITNYISKEQKDFIGKEFPQNCGDILKVIKRTNKRDNSGQILFECSFQKYQKIVYVRKWAVLNKCVDNPNLPWKSKENLKKYILDNFPDKKITLNELADLLNLAATHISNLINNFGLRNYIKYWPTQSKEEIYLEEYLNSIYDKEILYSNWDILKDKEIDIYIPNLKLGFEYNGNYWHSNEYLTVTYHQEKTLECNKKGIKLFHIFGYELDLKENIIKSLIKSKLNLFDKRFYARKCQIKELQYKEYADFCNENHLQGECGAKIKLGLFYNEELVQVMSFGSPRFTDKYEWEIIRECSKLGYIIIGGKEKLWKYFLKKYNPSNCLSYCDFSKFTGDSYLRLGFKLKQLNKPGFVWYDKVKDCVYWRNPQKHQEMKQKYFQIYDCGQLVFEWYKLIN